MGMKKPRVLHWTHRKRLQKFVDLVRGAVREMPVDELRSLQKSVDLPSETNCGWQQYQVAQILQPFVLLELDARLKANGKRKKAGSSESHPTSAGGKSGRNRLANNGC